MKDSEILKALISVTFAIDPIVGPSLDECLDLYKKTIIAEGIEELKVKEKPAPKTPAPKKNAAPAFTGQGAKEKREILERLQAYRKEHGLGCWLEVAERVPNLTDDGIRRMIAGEISVPIETWRAIDKALDKLEGSGADAE